MNDKDHDIALIQQSLDVLGEHFDSVQVFVTKHDQGQSDGTVCINLGAGNWYARYGQVKEWMVKQDEEARKHVRGNDDE